MVRASSAISPASAGSRSARPPDRHGGDRMTETTPERRLAELEAKEEIRAFIARYCVLNDALTEVDALVGLFSEDAVMRNPAGTHVGRAAIHAYYTTFFQSDTHFA